MQKKMTFLLYTRDIFKRPDNTIFAGTEIIYLSWIGIVFFIQKQWQTKVRIACVSNIEPQPHTPACIYGTTFHIFVWKLTIFIFITFPRLLYMKSQIPGTSVRKRDAFTFTLIILSVSAEVTKSFTVGMDYISRVSGLFLYVV